MKVNAAVWKFQKSAHNRTVLSLTSSSVARPKYWGRVPANTICWPNAGSMLAIVYDAIPTMTQHWFNSCLMWKASQQIRDIESMLGQRWSTVYDGGPTLTQHWLNICWGRTRHWNEHEDYLLAVSTQRPVGAAEKEQATKTRPGDRQAISEIATDQKSTTRFERFLRTEEGRDK